MAEARAQAASDAPYLLCFDGSDRAAEAIRGASAILQPAPALVVHVWIPPSALLLQGRVLAADHPLAEAAREFDASARETAEKLVGEGVEIARGAGFGEAEPVLIEVGHGVWRPIVELAAERGAAAVVVGSQGASAARSAILGSVSRGIVNHCTRPVVVVPTDRS